MKKNIFILTLAILAGISCVFASEYSKFSRKFMNHIKDCDTYEETSTSKFEDKDFTSHRKINGWKNGICYYTETLSSQGNTYKIDCRFTEIQLDELYEAMKDRSSKPEKYNLNIYEPKVDPKTGETTYVTKGTTLIKGNRAYIVWAKYENNPYFCRVQKIQ